MSQPTSTSGSGDPPSDPKQKWLGIAALVIIIGGAMFISFGGEIRREMLREELVAEGADARATVSALRQTGKFINDNPEVALSLRVEPEGAEAFEAEVVQTIAQVELASYRVGARVEVKYDPADHGRVVIMALIPPELPALPADQPADQTPPGQAPTTAQP